MLFVTLSPTETVTTQAQYLESTNDTLQAVTVEEPVVTRLEEELYVREKSYTTDNGKKLILGTLITRKNETSKLEIPITFQDEVIYIERIMAPGETWTYVKINGILIMPKSAGMLNPFKTSYYPKSDQLVISILPEGLNELDIYTENVPSLILSKTPVRWFYNDSTLNVKMSEKFSGDISVFFGHMPLSGTVFIEDTKNLEILEQKSVDMRNQISEMESQIEDFKAEIASIENEMIEINEETANITAAQLETKEAIASLNKTTTDLENRITTNIAITPAEVGIGIIIIISLLLILLYSFFFENKGEKK